MFYPLFSITYFLRSSNTLSDIIFYFRPQLKATQYLFACFLPLFQLHVLNSSGRFFLMYEYKSQPETLCAAQILIAGVYLRVEWLSDEIQWNSFDLYEVCDLNVWITFCHITFCLICPFPEHPGCSGRHCNTLWASGQWTSIPVHYRSCLSDEWLILPVLWSDKVKLQSCGISIAIVILWLQRRSLKKASKILWKTK